MYDDLVHKRSDKKAMPPRYWTKYRRYVQAEWYKISQLLRLHNEYW